MHVGDYYLEQEQYSEATKLYLEEQDSDVVKALEATERAIKELKRITDKDQAMNIRDDIIEECTKYGNVYHVYVDKTSPVCLLSNFYNI